jgi:hypothetical protein
MGKLEWYTQVSSEKRAVEITSGYRDWPNDGVRVGCQLDIGDVHPLEDPLPDVGQCAHRPTTAGAHLAV